MAVRKGDTIVVLGGKDRGKRGKIERVQKTRRGLAVVVPGINMAKRHQKSQGGRAQTAGIASCSAEVDVSTGIVSSRGFLPDRPVIRMAPPLRPFHSPVSTTGRPTNRSGRF